MYVFRHLGVSEQWQWGKIRIGLGNLYLFYREAKAGMMVMCRMHLEINFRIGVAHAF